MTALIDSPTSAMPPRTEYADGRVLPARALQNDGAHAEAALRQHQVSAHTAGIVAGLHVHAEPGQVDPPTRVVIISPGAAIDPEGRTLLLQRSWKFAERRINANECWGIVLSGVLERTGVTDSPFDRLQWQARLSLLRGTTEQDVEAQFAVLQIGVLVGIVNWAGEQGKIEVSSGTYVGAVGAAIEAPSGRCRILLGPESSADPRRFAISRGIRHTDGTLPEWHDILCWEATGNLRLHATTRIDHTAKSSQPAPASVILRARPAQQDATRSAGAAAGSDKWTSSHCLVFREGAEVEQEPAACRVHRVRTKDAGDTQEQLRISIVNPGAGNHPHRYRCSLGTASERYLPAMRQRGFEQTGTPPGILSVLANGSVEIVNALRVLRPGSDKEPGRILKLTPEGKPGFTPAAAPASAPVPVPVLIVADALDWDSSDGVLALRPTAAEVELRGELVNRTARTITRLHAGMICFQTSDDSPTGIAHGPFAMSIVQIAPSGRVGIPALSLKLEDDALVNSDIVAFLSISGVTDGNELVMVQRRVALSLPPPP